MNFRKFLFSAISVTFATAFFACSQMFAGSTETDNAFANEQDAISSSGIGSETTSSHNTDLPDTIVHNDTIAYLSSSERYTSSSSSSAHIIVPTSNSDSLVLTSPGSGGMGGGWGGFPGCIDSESVAAAYNNSIRINTFIDGRIEKLIATGLTPEQANSTARQELYVTLGIDAFLLENPIQMKYLSNLLNYILGGTVESDFYNEAKANFTETGTLSKDNYCNFNAYATTGVVIANTNYAFNAHTLFNGVMYNDKNCIGTLFIPAAMVNVIDAKCYDMPRCDSSITGTVIRASYKSSEGLFTCRGTRWEKANVMETMTFEVDCDEEGKYIFYDQKPDTSFVCSLNSGWHSAETIDAETFGIECDKHGKLVKSPNRPQVTYVCRKEYFCRDYGIYPKGPCFDSGWDFAGKTDLETANSECDSEGKTYQSPSDANRTYVCHDGKWTEFYNLPCDTDNERVKVKAQNITGYVEYICYNETWRPTYEWHAEYPAEYYFNPEINYGSFKDTRDNHVYRTIGFKGRTWIAENMKYAGFSASDLEKETRCLEDNCQNIGRFYSMNIASKVCPDGWRLPDSSDIETLGKTQTESSKLISQLGGTGANYSAPDTYGLSFILSGKIIDTDMPYSPLQGYSAFLWMNETNEDGGRLVVKVNYNNVVFDGYYTSLSAYFNAYPDMEPSAFTHETFLTVRCVKK